jgi:ADP-ribosylation factor related protein 1
MRMRAIWERYYSEAHAVVYVVDSADVGRLEEAKLAYGLLSIAIENPHLQNTYRRGLRP